MPVSLHFVSFVPQYLCNASCSVSCSLMASQLQAWIWSRVSLPFAFQGDIRISQVPG